MGGHVVAYHLEHQTPATGRRHGFDYAHGGIPRERILGQDHDARSNHGRSVPWQALMWKRLVGYLT
jgi:hypothetical protein